MKSCLISVLVIFLTTATILASDGNETDHLALLSFKLMITHDPYGALSSWNTSFHFCDWIGVSCGNRHRRVTVIRLIGQGLVGSLSPSVGNLSFLRELRLWNNSIQGTIPSDLGRLSRLGVLDIRRNKFSGLIPTNLSGCSNLEELRIGNNELVGSIPNEISFLSKLTYFAVLYNNLTGGIPPSLGNITSMEVFSAPGNPLGGTIPDTLGNWKNLREIYFGICNLHGTIPHSILNLSSLTQISLAENRLTGSLPSAFGDMVPNLVFLQLRNNQLDGLLPPSISNCSKLTIIEVNNNTFSGKMMIDFAKLRDIFHILLGNNLYGLTETVEMSFIDSLKNSSSLEVLDVTNGYFQGVLPSSIGNLSDRFRFLNLAENQLQGNLPSSIGNLVGLNTLYLEGNRFTGKIPSTIGMLQKLQVVGLDRNQFSGPIPDSIGNLSILNTLDLHSNGLEGNIPSSIGKCRNLLGMDLSNNKLTGEIPKQLLQLSSLSVVLNLSQNSLLGSLPIEVGELVKLSVLDLSFNNISGNIPSSLDGCTSLIFLSLKGNLFQGIIPSSLSSLRGVQELDLSHNNLSGQIPRFIERFSLENLNLSFNDFEGEVPLLGIFANASAFSILGNSRLCGGLVELGLPKCKETKKDNKKFPLFVIVILIAFTLLVVALFILYAWSKKKRKHQLSQISRNAQFSQSTGNGRFLKVSYKQLVKATDGFSEANLIGEGGFSSVYKGILDDDDKFVAVKVIHLQNRGAGRSFMAECEVWRNTRHRNLLKIITSCSSVDFQGHDFKALVYEFMPNGSLHDWLHPSGSKSKLDLLQRINILINVADALDYLHNHCPTTIVHGDLKPSNILLDDDMVAHVGDFGLARFLKTDSYKNNSTGIRGTIGYAPPEYGLGNEMTSSGDIYSFGILLLEVMTGKKPTDDIFSEGLNLHKFAYEALRDNDTDVIKEDLKKVHRDDEIDVKCTVENEKVIEECLSLTLKIGVSCSSDSPSHRMNIETVVHELQLILDTLQNVEEPKTSHVDQQKVVASEESKISMYETGESPLLMNENS